MATLCHSWEAVAESGAVAESPHKYFSHTSRDGRQRRLTFWQAIGRQQGRPELRWLSQTQIRLTAAEAVAVAAQCGASAA